MENMIIVEISTFRGICSDATHYYGNIVTSKPFTKVELRRPITEADIATPRFKDYEIGDTTNCFDTWHDVVVNADEYFTKNSISAKNAIVTGIPNNGNLSFEHALHGKVDTRLICSKCGKPIVGGFYNLPSGAICARCHDKN